LESGRDEVRFQLRVDDVQDVAVEFSCDTCRIVVGRDESCRILDQVGPAEETVSCSEAGSPPVEQRHPLCGWEVSDRASQYRHQAAQTLAAGVAGVESVVEVGCHRGDLQTWVAGGDPVCCLAQGSVADIDRNVSTETPDSTQGVE